jgi:Flp pilus assembly protein TadG
VWSRSRRRRQGEEGAAALEFALVLPILLILLLGTIAIGHGLVLRFLLSSAAYDAARTCTLARQATSSCARKVVENKLGGLTQWCSSLQVTTSNTKAAGYDTVNALQVDLNCSYSGIVSTAAYLDSNGPLIGNIKTRAVMPY